MAVSFRNTFRNKHKSMFGSFGCFFFFICFIAVLLLHFNNAVSKSERGQYFPLIASHASGKRQHWHPDIPPTKGGNILSMKRFDKSVSICFKQQSRRRFLSKHNPENPNCTNKTSHLNWAAATQSSSSILFTDQSSSQLKITQLQPHGIQEEICMDLSWHAKQWIPSSTEEQWVDRGAQAATHARTHTGSS